MTKVELQRLIKIEDRVQRIVTEELGLKVCPIEWDVIPAQKMLEIMAYGIPTNISNWKHGRDYERIRTIYENLDSNLPYEVVIHDNPARAYLMKDNVFAVQVLVMAHVYGHVNFFTENKWFQKSRQDIVELMASAQARFNEYEKIYGIDVIEQIVDAGHALQWHSNPFETETENDRRLRVFEQMKMVNLPDLSEYNDLVKRTQPTVDTANFNIDLWKHLKLKTPVEPVEDILRYVIDNSRILEDWQKDILEIIRTTGQYYWPIIKTKQMNEGYATLIHEYVCEKLFNEGILTGSEHGQFNYSNSLVKAKSTYSMNPYLIGSEIWKDIKNRWDKGQHGQEWNECENIIVKKEWDTKEMKGWEKVKEVMHTYTDWFFLQDFLTNEMVENLELYIYVQQQTSPITIDTIVTNFNSDEIRQMIVNSFAHSGIPKIDVINGNYSENGSILLHHRFSGLPLDKQYTIATMKHIYQLWGRPVYLKTKTMKGKYITYRVPLKDGQEVTDSNVNTRIGTVKTPLQANWTLQI